MVRNSTYFGQFLCQSSGVFNSTLGTGTSYTGLTTACLQDLDGTAVENSWWRAETLPETCRVSYRNKFGN
jgi:hypothetical protein